MVISAMTDITKHERSKFLQPRDDTVDLNLSAFDSLSLIVRYIDCGNG